MHPAEMAVQLERHGFALAPGLLAIDHIEQLKMHLSQSSRERSERGGDVYGARNLFSLPQVRATAQSSELRALLSPMLGPKPSAVRAIYFDKTPKANWPVPWHQDLSVALRARSHLPGWNNWTLKRGVLHAQAPAHILQAMITVRIHLDDCPAANGALRVVAGSHRGAVLTRAEIKSIADTQTVSTVAARAGDALLMKPLLLHASSPAQNPTHRRVLHLEFAPADLLPKELQWAEAL
jgi:hypothetical protein